MISSANRQEIQTADDMNIIAKFKGMMKIDFVKVLMTLLEPC